MKIKTSKSTGLRLAFASMLLAGALVLPSSALAQAECSQANSDPTAAQYCSPAGVHGGGNEGENEVKGTTEEGGEPSVAVEPAPEPVEATAVQESSSGSSLPFTGLDVGVLAIVALALGATGLFLRRLTTPRDTRS